MSRLKVEFDQPEHGWLKLELRSEDIGLSDTFSHVYPTLATLCDALCALAAGKHPRPVVFLLEPQELELSFKLQDSQGCTVTAVQFSTHRRDLKGDVLLEHSGRAQEVVLSFWRALRRLQTCLPEPEFATRWREPFPANEMAALTAAVETIKAEPRQKPNRHTAG